MAEAKVRKSGEQVSRLGVAGIGRSVLVVISL